MLNVVLSASLALSQMPASVPLPDALESHDVRAVVQASATHFVAQSTALDAQLLLIGNNDIGLLRATHLAPGQTIVWTFSRESVADTWVEVVQLDEHPRSTSGALSLTDVQSSDGGATWIEQTGGHSLAWTLEFKGLAHLAPLAEHEGNGIRGTFHVPGAPPSDARDKSKPPVIKDKPLPPV